MAETAFDLEGLVAEVLAATAEPVSDQPGDPATTMRERFFELLVLILANLYGKTPIPVTLLDRATIQKVTSGMEDSEAAKLASRGEDWIRLEGLIKQQEGQKAYFLVRPTLAVLSTLTSAGTLGEIIARIQQRYGEGQPTPRLRLATRTIGSYILMRLTR
jgi:hypothetical protein